MNKAKVAGIVLAISAAAAFAVAPAIAVAKSHHGNVHCMDVNACKGKGSCKGANNACKGKNDCKGKGSVLMSKEACEDIGGTVK